MIYFKKTFVTYPSVVRLWRGISKRDYVHESTVAVSRHFFP